jgi:hypothetical protein
VSPTNGTSKTNAFILTSMRLGVAVVLPQDSDEHRPERPILLAVDQELGHGSEDDAAGSG